MSLGKLLVVDYKSIGSFLRIWREKAGITQQEVSELFKYDSAQSISNWERGVSPIPKEKLFALLKLFKVPQHELVAFLQKEQEKALKRFLKAAQGARA